MNDCPPVIIEFPYKKCMSYTYRALHFQRNHIYPADVNTSKVYSENHIRQNLSSSSNLSSKMFPREKKREEK